MAGVVEPGALYQDTTSPAAEKVDPSPDCPRLKADLGAKIDDFDAGLKASSTRNWLAREFFKSL
jgi:hypothetical protein